MEKPPFDAVKAVFWLIAFVIGSEALVAVIGMTTCVIYARTLIKDPSLQCDPEGRLFQLLSSALAAALAFAAGFTKGKEPPKE